MRSVTPLGVTPPEVAAAQRQLRTLQWAIPALTGGIVSVPARIETRIAPLNPRT